MLKRKSKKKDENIFDLKKAYNDYDFLNSPSARPIRVLAEFIEPKERLRRYRIFNTIVFFGSARVISNQEAVKKLRKIKRKIAGSKKMTRAMHAELDKAQWAVNMSHYYEAACQLSKKLTLWFKELQKNNLKFTICSGGGPGIMEAANKGAQLANGKSIGLNISLPLEQEPNPYQTKDISFEFHYFFIRKFWFFYLAKALLIFPGGYGTFDELFELLTLVQTNKSKKKMPIILFGSQYWNDVVDFQKMVQWGTISKEDLKLFKVFDDVEATFQHLKKELSKLYIKN